MTRWRAPLLLALAVTAGSGCALGERPTLAETPTASGSETGDPAIDAALARLDSVGTAVFTAEYKATALFGGTETTVRAVRAAADRYALTVGSTRFITQGSSTQTCDLDAGACEPGIDAARVSDTLVFPDMIWGDLAKRLRRDATAKVGETTSFDQTVAGQDVYCVDVVVSGGTKQWCVLENGVIARYVGGDVRLELLSYAPSADESLFLTVR